MNSTIFHVYLVDRLIIFSKRSGVHKLDGKKVRDNGNDLVMFPILQEHILELLGPFTNI